jgi:Flp pilus assembly protein TadD
MYIRQFRCEDEQSMTDDFVSRSLQQAADHVSARRPRQAVGICRQILARFPDDAKTHYLLAIALAETGQPNEAVAAYKQSVRLNPEFFQAFTNLAVLLGKQGRLEEAIEAFSHAAELRPDLAEMHVNLSNVLRDSWKLEEAVAAARKALSLKPDLAEANLSLGAALQMTGRFDEAIAACREAIRLRPNMASAHLNLALAELVLGNLERGWPEYEWRKQCAEILPPRRFSEPMWDGSRLDGRTILLYCEQGFGDAIHFIRYAPRVAEMCGRVILECPAPLLRIVGGYPSIHQIVPAGESLPAFDVQCALPSLPGRFKTTLESIPTAIPYLSADPDLAKSWRERIKPAQNVRPIGLAWAGRPENRNDRNRSIPLEKFSPLGEIPGAQFHSVLPIRPSRFPFAMSDWSASLRDFADTAALMANLDLIVTVDTAAAHLAGAMGKRVWLLLPFPPDWRWMLSRADSPWYPTIQIFRQETPGDWDSVIRRVAGALRTGEDQSSGGPHQGPR